MTEIIVDQEVCIQCGACIGTCSVTHVYAKVDEQVQAISPSRCWDCGQCMAICPVDAITHSSFPLDECPLIDQAEDDLEKLTGFLRERRSTRVYQNKRVERDVVEKLVSHTRWAPTGKNLQAIEWLIMDDPETILRLSRKTVETLLKSAEHIRATLTPDMDEHDQKYQLMMAKSFEQLGRRTEKGEEPIFFGAPAVLAAITPRSHFGRDDAVISGYTLELAAVQMGLATCQVGYFMGGLEFDPELGKGILNIPDDREIQMMLTLGYPKYKLRRMVQRKPLNIRWIDGAHL